ncbi:GNAT family N-acetyltransferase [Saprospiraceae bacterium]|jgi:L-amino acid N-acyltransferase YncA|nr:GNAT family N-acetyltransferase [Bacteroidota bacterium]MDB4727603.1 GNAT family N-acetyltransferase [Saprospiraceae bacterium]
MITYGVANSQKDLEQILHLQQINLPTNISNLEAEKEGFVTVEHDLNLLNEMNEPYPHIVARENEKVVGYALVMLRSLEEKIPILVSMFKEINLINYKKQLLANAKYLVMGQICIDKAYRGKGIFQGLYDEMNARLSPHFQYIITEVSARNIRSLKAHYKVGFKEIKKYKGETGENWIILLLNMQNKNVS